MIQYSWQRLDGGLWGVKASGNLNECLGLSGRSVTVTSRKGNQKVVVLGALHMQWNAGRAAVYLIEGPEGQQQARRTVDLEPGEYELDGERYKVKLTRDRKRTYAERWNPTTSRWDYAKGMVYKLRPTDRVTEVES